MTTIFVGALITLGGLAMTVYGKDKVFGAFMCGYGIATINTFIQYYPKAIKGFFF